MARTLNRLLPSSSICVITWTEKRSRAWILFCNTWGKTGNLQNLYSSCQRMTEGRTQRRVVLRGLSFEERDLATVSASLAWAAPNLECERVVCSMEEIQFPLTCCFIPASVFPPLTSSPAQPLKSFWPEWMERYSLELTFSWNWNSSDIRAIVCTGEDVRQQKCPPPLGLKSWVTPIQMLLILMVDASWVTTEPLRHTEICLLGCSREHVSLTLPTRQKQS